jgi:hypothetical protein
MDDSDLDYNVIYSIEDVPDFIRDDQNELEIEFGSEFNNRLADVYAQLKKRSFWIRGFFGTVYRNEADIDEVV